MYTHNKVHSLFNFPAVFGTNSCWGEWSHLIYLVMDILFYLICFYFLLYLGGKLPPCTAFLCTFKH